jgi:hypothetical protein
MAAKKTEEKKEAKLPKIEELYGMKFEGSNGEILMVRKAYGGKPRGRLEIYTPSLKEEK